MTMLSAGISGDDDVASAKAMLANYKTTVSKLLDSNEGWAISANLPSNWCPIFWRFPRRRSS